MRVEQHFTAAKMAAAMLEVYREMLKQPCRADVPAMVPHAEEVGARPAKWA
jgi:hypothetical protein